ncbi:MAG TPA: hypothetical protein VGF56_11210 [Rhizomicrobium sp.]|jgi:hypothetical protein
MAAIAAHSKAWKQAWAISPSTLASAKSDMPDGVVLIAWPSHAGFPISNTANAAPTNAVAIKVIIALDTKNIQMRFL